MNNLNSQSSQWEEYWKKQKAASQVYGRIASFYRKFVIAPSVQRTLESFLFPGALILHAGSGSGEIDVLLPPKWKLIAIDFSSEAVRRHRQTFLNHCLVSDSVQADLFRLPFRDGQFMASFNLGVMEHFDDDDVIRALNELRRVTSNEGRLVLYWPPIWGPTVIVLHSIAFILKVLGKSNIQLHPPEINLFRSKKHCRDLLRAANLEPVKFIYGPTDMFTHMIIIAKHA
jgi:SAM-dependent methyltransferase